MIIYVPLMTYELPEEEGHIICDGILQYFLCEADAQALYPNTEIQMIEIPEINYGKKTKRKTHSQVEA